MRKHLPIRERLPRTDLSEQKLVMTQKKPDIGTIAENVRALFVGGVAGFALFFYFAQPLLFWAAPAELALGGALTGLGVFLVYLELLDNRPEVSPKATYGTMFFIIGTGMLGVALISASYSWDANQEDCRRIQNAIQHPTPRTRKDLPEVFQALGCRVQR
jgi:hypothetical protein